MDPPLIALATFTTTPSAYIKAATHPCVPSSCFTIRCTGSFGLTASAKKISGGHVSEGEKLVGAILRSLGGV